MSQGLSPSDMYALAPPAAEAHTVEMRMGRDTVLACYFSRESFKMGMFGTDFFHRDLLLLHVIKYYVVNISE